MDAIGEEHLWHSISAAVKAARETHGITAAARPFEPEPEGIPPGTHPYGHRRRSHEDEHGRLEQ
jgi:hypothetical protein